VRGNATIGVDGFVGGRIANEGAIDQTGSGGQLYIAANNFENSGTIDAEATRGSLTIDRNGLGTRTTITNTGTIDAANGESVVIQPNVIGKGPETISGGSTLEFGARVSTAKTLGDQDIDFTGAGTLHLLKPASFYGEISGFAVGDTAELLGSWTFSGISQAGDVTTLTLASGSTTHAFELGGNYAQSNFNITSGTTTTIRFA
jgi:hypothetical protein